MEEKGPRRLYSICSGELEEEIHILYKVVDEGFLTPQLSDLEIGNTIWITAPGGEFTGDKDPALKYYLCGSADMVVEARDILISKGIPFGNIISEIYF